MSLASLVVDGPIGRGAKDAAPVGGPVWQIQDALRLKTGAEILVDGDYGRNTHAAVVRFQAANGLPVSGRVGPLTAAALDEMKDLPLDKREDPLPSSMAFAPWLSVSRALTGTKEFSGGADNPIILEWKNYVVENYPATKPNVAWYKHDATPWCGLHAAYCVAKAHYPPTEAPLYALNWGKPWKDGIRLPGPALGAIVTMSRSGGGHVTFYEGEDSTSWFGRGGNQSDMVNVAKFPKSRKIEGYFWPKGAPLPDIGPVRVSFRSAVAGTEA